MHEGVMRKLGVVGLVVLAFSVIGYISVLHERRVGPPNLPFELGGAVVVVDHAAACTTHWSASDQIVVRLPKGRTGRVVESKVSPSSDWSRIKLDLVEDGPANGRACWVRSSSLEKASPSQP